jgi:integrase/recombinase XerD
MPEYAELTVFSSANAITVPAILANAGHAAVKRWAEFFTVPIRNPNTRQAYYRAINQFLAWCDQAGFRHLEDIEPITVAAYIERHPGSPATKKQHMAAIRMLFSWLTEKGILAMNPAREVQTERFSRIDGKTPAFAEGEIQQLLNSINVSDSIGLRDRAFLATLAYTFARISAVIGLRVQDYFPSGKRSVLRFREKGGKEKELPVHHRLEEFLDEYLDRTGFRGQPDAPLFPATRRGTGTFSGRSLSRDEASYMIKRRLRQAGMPEHYSAHSFRAAGITNFLTNGGALEVAQRIAGHADSRTTKLYDRRAQHVLVEDMERIRY